MVKVHRDEIPRRSLKRIFRRSECDASKEFMLFSTDNSSLYIGLATNLDIKLESIKGAKRGLHVAVYKKNTQLIHSILRTWC